MRLSLPFFHKKKETSVYYLALLLTSEKVSAVILEESLGKLKITNKQHQFFTENIEDLSMEELINAVDKAISQAEEILPPDIEIRKTVFGVKEGWVEEGSKKIKKNYLQKLKKICDSLDLSPIGFMVVSEAISSLMQQEEGAPLSAIFIELGKKIVTLTLYRGGNNIQTIDGPVDGTYASTVDMLLKRFVIEVLPARIILYDTEINEGLIQQFISHQWGKSLPFLHMPQISVLPSGFDGRAVAFGAATQMGFEVLDPVSSEIKTYNSSEEKKLTPASTNEARETVASGTDSSSIPVVNFGFILGEDIGEQASPAPIYISPIEEPKQITNEPQDEIVRERNNSAPKKKNIFSSIRLPGINLSSFTFKGPKIPLIILVILLLAGSIIGGVYYLYFNKVNATVFITLTPKKITEERDVIFTVDNPQDFSNNVLGAKTIISTLDGDMTAGATGKKDVGDKAKGTVIIYSKLPQSKTFSSGTVITFNGHEFILDKDVAVASSSGDASDEPSKVSVPVTAKDIGSDSNLPSGVKFAVAGFDLSDVVARNDNAFSGGSKKTVTVVSKDDLAKLKTELIKNLEVKASRELAKQVRQDSVVLPIVLSANVEKTKYDKNADDEAKAVKLIASISFTGLSYQETEIKKYAKEILEKNYPEDILDENNITIKIKDAEQKNQKEVTASLIINASLLPKINNQEISKQLSGKSGKEVEVFLSHIPQIERSEIRYTPNISFFSKLFPRLPNHITVNVSSN